MPLRSSPKCVDFPFLLPILLLLGWNIIHLAHGAPFSQSKLLPGDAYNECLDSNGMERQLRSDGLNSYLFGLARCISSVGRPRFGKRSSWTPLGSKARIPAYRIVMGGQNALNVPSENESQEYIPPSTDFHSSWEHSDPLAIWNLIREAERRPKRQNEAISSGV